MLLYFHFQPYLISEDEAIDLNSLRDVDEFENLILSDTIPSRQIPEAVDKFMKLVYDEHQKARLQVIYCMNY